MTPLSLLQDVQLSQSQCWRANTGIEEFPVALNSVFCPGVGRKTEKFERGHSKTYIEKETEFCFGVCVFFNNISGAD